MSDAERGSSPSSPNAAPDSRAPVIPSEPTAADLERAAAESERTKAPAVGRAGTVRMSASDLPANRARPSGPSGTVRMMAGEVPANRTSSGAPGTRGSGGRGSATSLSGGRPSRLMSIRQTIMSVLPPIPKQLSGAPLVALGFIVSLLVGAIILLGATNRFPDGMKRFNWGRPAETAEAFVPPPVPEGAEVVDDLVGPSAAPGRANVGRGVLSIPKTFRANADGGFDFVIHFNGNTELAVESYEVALLDAVVLVVNLGNGSGVYEEPYSNPDNLDRILQRVPEIVKKRGLENAHIRRLALVGWSAGYGAIVKILEHPKHADLVDAVILLDGLHTSYMPGTTQVDGGNIAGVTRFAERAKAGEKLLVITHSNIQPGDYLGVHETTDFLLSQVGVERHAASAQTTLPGLKAAKGVLPKDELRALELKSEARSGNLIVRGFGGDQAAHHVSHLLQMSEIALPELAKRWAPIEPAPAASAEP